jgi:antitoxin HigA-1
MARKRISAVHPGAYLRELMSELTLSQSRITRDIGVPARRIHYVVNGKRPVNAELALRLGRYFRQEPRYWLNLQSRYDLDIAEDTLADKVGNADQVFDRTYSVSIGGVSMDLQSLWGQGTTVVDHWHNIPLKKDAAKGRRAS